MTITISKLTFSNHFRTDRTGRYKTFQRIGFGQIVKQQWYNGCWHCLTDMGIMLVVDEAGNYCMTAYFADWVEVNRIYQGNVPRVMKKRIDRNVSYGYTKARYKG